MIEKNQCQLSFICENLKTTTVKYKEIKKNTMILSEYLQKQGIGQNDTVISIAPNREQNVFFTLAALNIGAKWIAFDPKMQTDFFSEYIKTIKQKLFSPVIIIFLMNNFMIIAPTF